MTKPKVTQKVRS